MLEGILLSSVFQVKLQNPSIITKMKIVMQPNYKVFLIVEKMEVGNKLEVIVIFPVPIFHYNWLQSNQLNHILHMLIGIISD